MGWILWTHAALLRPSAFATPSSAAEEDVRVEDATVISDVDVLAQFRPGELARKNLVPVHSYDM